MCTHRGDDVITLHRKIVNNIFKKFSQPGACCFKSNGLLKITEIYKLRAATYMYRVLKLNEIPELRRVLQLQLPDHNHDTRNSDMLVPPFPRIEALRMNFQHQFINIWNEIPIIIKEKPSLSSFKYSLKHHFINQY